jgi:glycosyltransferase involved in cell wall biosynthesis
LPPPASDSARSLFISYDGLTDPLGRSQVLPYLAGLARRGHRITILSAEKRDRLASDGARVGRICEAAGLEWRPLRYHRRPPVLSGAWDLAAMQRAAAALHRERRFDLVHCRSYIPAIAGLALKRRFGMRLLFDMRGFWVEEKVEGGSWPLSNALFRAVYHYFKRRESDLLREADAIVSLTDSARAELERRPELAGREGRITVIPCCVDLGHFHRVDGDRALSRAALGLTPETPVLAYLGSLGGNYMLDEMLAFFRAFRERCPGAVFLFVSRDDPATIRAAASACGVAPEELIVRAAAREEVPALLAAADLGVAFKRASFSALACSPTKLGEMLAVGIPVVANARVGDVASVLSEGGAGALVERFDHDSLLAAVDAALASSPPAQIRAVSARHFDLEEGIARYDALYRALAAEAAAFPRPEALR